VADRGAEQEVLSAPWSLPDGAHRPQIPSSDSNKLVVAEVNSAPKLHVCRRGLTDRLPRGWI
jgi:hypothetical protein